LPRIVEVEHRPTRPSYVEGYLSDVCVEGGVNYPQGISASRLARNKIPMATPIFLGSNFSTVLSVTLPNETTTGNTVLCLGMS